MPRPSSTNPGVVIRSGPRGPRAAIVGGPDVWEVVRAVRSARAAEPDLTEAELAAMLEENTGVPDHMVRAALDHWSARPDEVDALIQQAVRIEAGVATD